VNHLTPNRIYAYLDGDVSAPDRRDIEAHLAGCGACRAAVAERRLLAQAADGLPPIEIPDGFAAAVAARLPSRAPARAARKPFLLRPAAGAAGLALFVLAGAAALVLGGANLPDFVHAAGRFVRGNIEGLASLLARGAGYAGVAARVVGKLLGQLLEGFRVLSSFIGPEVQVACAAGALILAVAGFALWRRRPLTEKDHEE